MSDSDVNKGFYWKSMLNFHELSFFSFFTDKFFTSFSQVFQTNSWNSFFVTNTFGQFPILLANRLCFTKKQHFCANISCLQVLALSTRASHAQEDLPENPVAEELGRQPLCWHFKYVNETYTARKYASRAARGGGGSFKNRKRIGEIGCCESRMTKQKHWWIELYNGVTD